jgi:ABC transporter DrrB family efflux protein
MTATVLDPADVAVAPPSVTQPTLAEWWRHTLVFAGRNVQHIRRLPEKLLDVTIQPIMFVLLFAYVFGGAIGVPGGNYREFLIGGILVQSLSFAMVGPATSIATDLQEGVIDRFRALPAKRSAYLSGHFLAELGGMALSIVILLGSGLVVGWRPHEGVGNLMAGLLLLLLFAAAMVWIGTFIGLMVRTPDAVMGVGFTVVFPITFLSNAFVPTDTLPDVLQRIAEWNPISVMVAGIRDLFGNSGGQVGTQPWPIEHAIVLSFVACGLLLALAIPFSLRRYRSRTID